MFPRDPSGIWLDRGLSGPHSPFLPPVAGAAANSPPVSLLLVWTAPGGTECVRMRSLLISDKETVRGTNRPNRNGYVEARFPASWRECRRGAGLAQEAAAQGDGGVLREACTDGDRDRSLRCEPSLGAAAAIVRAYGEVDPAPTGQALRQTRQERCGGRRRAVRGDEPPDDALRAGEDGRTAGCLDAGRRARPADPQSHTVGQRYP